MPNASKDAIIPPNRFVSHGTKDSDTVSGSPVRKDILIGHFGDDWLYGEGAPVLATTMVDFTSASVWEGVTGGTMSLSGLTLTATGGALAQFYGASVSSPTDSALQPWTFEIDAYNDQPESLALAFDTVQTHVELTIAQLYREQHFRLEPEAEMVDLTIAFSDGTSTTVNYQATATAFPGELRITVDSVDLGGKLITGIELAPNPALPPLRPHLPAEWTNHYNTTVPFTEFVLKDVRYDHVQTPGGASDDILLGKAGADKMYGGGGNDRLHGNAGDDLLVGGAGDNVLKGEAGDDTFLFGFDAKGYNIIRDFEKGGDRLALTDGIVIVSSAFEKSGTLLSLSNGGEIFLQGLKVAHLDDLF